MKKISFKDAIEKLGYEIVKYNYGYNYRSAFGKDKDGQLWYFSIEDLRDEEPFLMYRTAENDTDYKGGTNRWDMNDRLRRLGYEVKEERIECDFNSN